MFDGHGGSRTSEFLKNNFHTNLCDELIAREPHDEKDGKRRAVKVKESLLATVKKTEEQLTALDDLRDGSTAAVCLLLGDEVTTCNLGDSRALLARLPKN